LASTTFYAIIATYFSRVLWCLGPCTVGENVGAINIRNTKVNRRSLRGKTKILGHVW
jgi:hypothetical protein